MSAKQTASDLLNQLDDNASWGEVKDTIMGEYKRETGDAKADALAAVIIAAVFVCACVFWISSQ
jgi:diacylglycerol kinase